MLSIRTGEVAAPHGTQKHLTALGLQSICGNYNQLPSTGMDGSAVDCDASATALKPPQVSARFVRCRPRFRAHQLRMLSPRAVTALCIAWRALGRLALVQRASFMSLSRVAQVDEAPPAALTTLEVPTVAGNSSAGTNA